MRKTDPGAPVTPTIQVIESMFSLIDVLASREEAVSLKEISEKTGLHPSTTHRILNDLALRFDPEVRVRAYEIAIGKRRLVLSAFHLFVGAMVLIVLPQVLYLLSRNVTLQLSTAPYVFFHPDQWQAGSAGNCGLPGNAACSPELKPDALQPAVAALLWTSIAIVLLWLERNERRAKSLCYLGA